MIRDGFFHEAYLVTIRAGLMNIITSNKHKVEIKGKYFENHSIRASDVWKKHFILSQNEILH